MKKVARSLKPNVIVKRRRYKKHHINVVVTKKSPQAVPQNVTEEEVVRRAQEADVAVNRAIQLRARAQALMEQADLATYRAVMATRIAEAKSANVSTVVPIPQPKHDVLPSATSDLNGSKSDEKSS